VKDAYLALVPAGRWGTPQDVADAVLYFAARRHRLSPARRCASTAG